MVNTLIRYFWMYLLLGLVCNLGLSIALSIYVCTSLRFDNDAISEVFDCIVGVPGGYKLFNDMIKTKDGKKEYFKTFIQVQLIWPCNVSLILTGFGIAKEYIKNWRLENPLIDEKQS